jgi:hypothetical protein
MTINQRPLKQRPKSEAHRQPMAHAAKLPEISRGNVEAIVSLLRPAVEHGKAGAASRGVAKPQR